MFGPTNVIEQIAPFRRDWRAQRMSRGEFLNRAAQVGAFAGVGQRCELIAEATVPLIDALNRVSDRDLIIPAISDVLFGTQRDIRFLAGADHPKFNSVHPDNLSTIAPLINRYFDGCHLISREDTQLIFSSSIDTSLGIVGGAPSSIPAQLILGYEPIDDKNPTLGLKLIDNPLFQFVYDFVYDARKLPKVRRFINGDIHEVPNWSLEDTRSDRTNRLLSPAYKDGNLISDYLLITVLPNILSLKSYEEGKRIVLIMGTHGVGTLAALDVFANYDAVNLLARNSREYLYWQALIKINNISISAETGTSIPVDIDYEHISVEPVRFNRRVLMDGFVERSRAQLTAGMARDSQNFLNPRTGVAQEQQSIDTVGGSSQASTASCGPDGPPAVVFKDETMCSPQYSIKSDVAQALEKIISEWRNESEQLRSARAHWQPVDGLSESEFDLATKFDLHPEFLTMEEIQQMNAMIEAHPGLTNLPAIMRNSRFLKVASPTKIR